MSYSITNKEQRFSDIQNTPSELFVKHTELINAYLAHFFDNIYIQKKETYNYIIKKGITTITHVLNIMYMKSYNIDLAIDYAQRASFYYVEFIHQLGDEQSILGLGPKDATLFAYKKTIFEIPDDIESNNTNSAFINSVIKITTFFNNIISYIIENAIDNEKESIPSLTKGICSNISSYDCFHDKASAICIFSEYLMSKEFKSTEIIQILDLFTKMLIKHNITEEEINKKLLNHSFDTNLSNNPTKFMKWLFMY